MRVHSIAYSPLCLCVYTRYKVWDQNFFLHLHTSWFDVLCRCLLIHSEPSAYWTLDFSVSHMDKAWREELRSHKLLIVKTFKSQVVWCLLNKATVTVLQSSVGGLGSNTTWMCFSSYIILRVGLKTIQNIIIFLNMYILLSTSSMLMLDWSGWVMVGGQWALCPALCCCIPALHVGGLKLRFDCIWCC